MKFSLRRAVFSLPRSSRIAIQAGARASDSSKCPAIRKPPMPSRNSMGLNTAVGIAAAVAAGEIAGRAQTLLAADCTDDADGPNVRGIGVISGENIRAIR